MSDTKLDEAIEFSDLGDFDTTAAAEQGAVMEVCNPHTGAVLRHTDGRPFTIRFLGKDSKKLAELSRKQQDRYSQARQRSNAPILAAVLEKDVVEQLVAATLEWDIVLGGQKLESNPKNYRAVYSKYKWLYEQGMTFVGARSNFSKA